MISKNIGVVLFLGASLLSSAAFARSPKLPPGFPSDGVLKCKVDYAEQTKDTFNSVEGTFSQAVLKGSSSGAFDINSIKNWKQKYGTENLPSTVNDPHSVNFSSYDGSNLSIQAVIVKVDAKGEPVSFNKASMSSSTRTAEVNSSVYTPIEDQILTLHVSCTYEN